MQEKNHATVKKKQKTALDQLVAPLMPTKGVAERKGNLSSCLYRRISKIIDIIAGIETFPKCERCLRDYLPLRNVTQFLPLL